MQLSKLWRLYEADKRIQEFSTRTLKAYALQHKMLMQELGNLDITEVIRLCSTKLQRFSLGKS